MSSRVNVETFNVRSYSTGFRPWIRQGLPVRLEGAGYYVVPTARANTARDQLFPSDHLFLLDAEDPPETSEISDLGEAVITFSARELITDTLAVRSIENRRAYFPVDRAIGRVTLVELRDLNGNSFREGRNVSLRRSKGVVIVNQFRSSQTDRSGTTSVIMPEKSAVDILQKKDDGTPDGRWQVIYDPESEQRLLLYRYLEGHTIPEPPEDPPTIRLGDRVPLNTPPSQDRGTESLELPSGDDFAAVPVRER